MHTDTNVMFREFLSRDLDARDAGEALLEKLPTFSSDAAYRFLIRGLSANDKAIAHNIGALGGMAGEW